MHPFENQIMRDPETRPPGSVVSYNQEHLDALHHRLLERIDAEDNLNQALVLLSTNPGFGKTHLLARLIETTRGFCVPVFVPPTNAGRNYGGAVLDRVVSRLLALPVGSGNGSRLDWLTFQLISQVCEDAATTRLWREFNLTNLDETDFQVGLLAQRPALISSLTRFLPDLTRHQLLEPPGIWATALMEIVSFDPIESQRALEWMKARVMHYPGSRESENEPPLDEELARAERRLFDLANLLGRVRPLVLFFDQVENFESFGPEALGNFFHLLERLLACSPATQIVIAANAVDWGRFLSLPGISPSHRERLMPPRVLRGLTFDEAKELRDLRAENELREECRTKISDEAIADFLMLSASGRAGISRSPRQFLQWCAARWVAIVMPENAGPDLEGEWAKVVRLEEKEPLAFQTDTLRTFFLEIGAANLRRIEGREFFDFGGNICFFEPGHHHIRWGNWFERASELGVADAEITAVRPSPALCAAEGGQFSHVPGPQWNPKHRVHRFLAKGGHILLLEPQAMRQIAAACRFLNAASDFGVDRESATAWLRDKWASDELGFF